MYIYIQWDVTPLFFEISPRSPPAMNPSWDALLPMTWPRNLPMALSLLSITASAPSRMALATSHASAPRRHRSHWENLRTLAFQKCFFDEAFQNLWSMAMENSPLRSLSFHENFPVISLKWPKWPCHFTQWRVGNGLSSMEASISVAHTAYFPAACSAVWRHGYVFL